MKVLIDTPNEVISFQTDSFAYRWTNDNRLELISNTSQESYKVLEHSGIPMHVGKLIVKHLHADDVDLRPIRSTEIYLREDGDMIYQRYVFDSSKEETLFALNIYKDEGDDQDG